MTDLHSSAGDDALPPPTTDLRDIDPDNIITSAASPPPGAHAAAGSDDAGSITGDKPTSSHDGVGECGSPPPPAAAPNPAGTRNPVSPELLRQVDDVLSSQVRPMPPRHAASMLTLL